MLHRTYLLRCSLALAVIVPTLVSTAVHAQSVSRGQQIVESRCFACHSLDANRVGPALRGVVGRKVGTAPDFDYSKALASAKGTWDTAGIKVWLTNPEKRIPGQEMNYQVDLAQDREDVVAYLASLSPPAKKRQLDSKGKTV